jgi:hypothetical protein
MARAFEFLIEIVAAICFDDASSTFGDGPERAWDAASNAPARHDAPRTGR